MLKVLGAAAALLLLAIPAAAREARPALWVVEDADTTIYLFGTIHVLKPGLDWFDGPVKQAFDRSGELVIEIAPPTSEVMRAMVEKTALHPEGPTITEQLPGDKRAAYAAALAEDGIPIARIDHYEPWFAAVTLAGAPLRRLGYNVADGVENQLIGGALDQRKQITPLETPAQQLGYFEGLPAPVQLRYLVSTIDELPDMRANLEKTIAYWTAGEPDALAAQINGGFRDNPEMARVLLPERNARWAKWIEARLARPGIVFLAVGAGHLAGADSVQAMLARDHVVAARVPY